MKVNCPVCSGSKICHIVWSHRTEYHDQYGIDWVTKAKLKIHKHRRGKNLCKGSDKIILIDSLESAEGLVEYMYVP